MKTEELIKKANKLGYKVKKAESGTVVFDGFGCCIMARISEDYDNMVDLSYAHYMSDDLFDLIVSYAKTLVEERKSAKKYSVKVLPCSGGYLNVRYGYGNTDTNHYLISDTEEMTDYKTKFTEDEIEELKKQPDLVLDWERVTPEEAN